MPITITTPLPNQPTGPGFTVSGSTSVGPTPVDDVWLVRITPEGQENLTVIYGCKLAAGFTSFSVQVGGQSDCTTGISEGLVSLPQNAAARLVVEQRHADSTLVDSLSIPVVWDGVGQLWNYGQNLKGWGATSTGGLTPDQADQLQRILDAVYRTWPGA